MFHLTAIRQAFETTRLASQIKADSEIYQLPREEAIRRNRENLARGKLPLADQAAADAADSALDAAIRAAQRLGITKPEAMHAAFRRAGLAVVNGRLGLRPPRMVAPATATVDAVNVK